MTRVGAAACDATVAMSAAAAIRAQSSYFIVQDMGTKRCHVVSQKPVSREVTVVGEDGYATQMAAESAMKTVKVCTE